MARQVQCGSGQEFCVVRSRIFREVWVADFASRSYQKSPIGSAFDAYGADHAHIGWRLELNLDLIIALEGKINIERHSPLTAVPRAGMKAFVPPALFGTVTR